MNRKLNWLDVGTIVAVCVLASILLAAYWMGTQTDVWGPSDMEVEELRIVPFGWNVPLARAEFNLTAHRASPHPSIDLDHVEVNGVRVDVYPQNLSLKPGQSAIARVYYSYDYDSKYEFYFITEEGNRFGPCDLTSPPEREL